MELSCRLTGKSQRAVGEHYGGLSCAAVAYHRRRLRDAMENDPELAVLVRRIEAGICENFNS